MLTQIVPPNAVRPLAAALLLLTTPPTLAQSVTASFTIEDPTPTCSFAAVAENLVFGTLSQPPVSVSVTVSAVDGSADSSPAGYTPTGHMAGKFEVECRHANSATVTATNPGKLAQGSNELPFAPAWATSSTDGGTYTTRTYGGPVSLPGLSGAHSTGTLHFRVGGTVSGISSTTPAATYTGTITITLSPL